MTLRKEDNPFTPGRCAPHPMPPLQYAVYNIGYDGEESILALLEAGEEPDAADEDGNTALHQAVLENEPDIYALLVQTGADQHIPNWSGETAAMKFERQFGVSYEKKYEGRTIDAAYIRKELEDG